MRGRGVTCSVRGASAVSSVPMLLRLALRYYLFTIPFFACGLRFTCEIGNQAVPMMHELFPGAPAIRRSDRVLAEEWERDRRVAVRDDGVGKDAGIDFAPA